MEKKYTLCNKPLILSVMVFLCMGRTTAGAQVPVKSGMSSKCDYTVCSSESTCDGSLIKRHGNLVSVSTDSR